jgi:hypothetical protein
MGMSTPRQFIAMLDGMNPEKRRTLRLLRTVPYGTARRILLKAFGIWLGDNRGAGDHQGQ